MAARRRFFYWILHHLPLTDSASRNQYPGPSTLSNTCQVLSDEFTTKDPGIKRREEGWFFHLQWHLVLRNWSASWSTLFLPIITLTAYYKIRICVTQKHMVFPQLESPVVNCLVTPNLKYLIRLTHWEDTTVWGEEIPLFSNFFVLNANVALFTNIRLVCKEILQTLKDSF